MSEDQTLPNTKVDELQTLIGQLRDADARSAQGRAVLGKIEGLLLEIGQSADYKQIADSEVVQAFVEKVAEIRAASGGLKPGQIINPNSAVQSKRAWGWGDLAGCETRTFTPNETIPVTWNGLTIYLEADQETTIPIYHYRVYEEHRRLLRAAREHAEYLAGQRQRVTIDPSILTIESARIRGAATSGHYVPGGGLIAMGEETEGENTGAEA